MASFISFSFVTVLLISGIQSGAPISVAEYLEIKLQETKDVLLKNYHENAKAPITDLEDRDYTGHWTKLWDKTSTTTRPRSIRFLDQTFILDNDTIHSIPRSLSDYHEPLVLGLARKNEPLKFSKSFSWGQSSFLLLCFEKYCSHYGDIAMPKSAGQQQIEFCGFLPRDGSYFARGDQIFLLITFTVGKNQSVDRSVSKLYEWSGSSMKYVAGIESAAVNSLAVVQDDEATIIILALENHEVDEEGRKVDAILYDFNYEKKTMEQVALLSAADRLVYVHPFYFDGDEFVLLVGDRNTNGLYWWDGTGLRKWCSIPEIEAGSSVNVVWINDETLLFVKNPKSLDTYKVTKQGIHKLDDLSLRIEEDVIEFSVWAKNDSVWLLLVKPLVDGTFGVEHWQLDLQPKLSETTAEDISKCFEELEELLNLNMPEIENLSRFNTSNIQSKNVTNNESLSPTREFRNEESAPLFGIHDENDHHQIRNLEDIENELLSFEDTLERIIPESVKVFDGQIAYFSGHIVIDGDVHLEELNVDYLSAEYLNGEKIEFENLLIPGLNQTYYEPLRAKNIFIDNLDIQSLCGLDSNYWYRIDDPDKMKLDDLQIEDLAVENGTIVVQNDLVVPDLKTKLLNGVNFQEFLDDLFLIGKNQTIHGNVTYQKLARVMNFTTDIVNEVSASLLLTKYTNQSLDDVFIDSLDVKNLFVDKINGVPVDQAARISQENVIKGRVNIANLVITDELIVDEGLALPLTYPTQVYDEVVIDGDVFIKNLMIENDASLQFNYANLTPHDIGSIVESSWSKSKNQTIKESVILEKGISIDELNCTLINGLTENDFLYTDSDEMDDLENVTFQHFHFHGVMNNGSEVADRFFEATPHSLIFHKAIRMTRLSVDNVFSDRYNGIQIDSIIRGDDSIKFHGTTEFDVVQVNKEMIVDDLQITRLNNREVGQLDQILFSNKNLSVDSLKMKDMSVRNLHVKMLNGRDLERALLLQQQLISQPDSVTLTIDGDLEIEENLQVDTINEMNTTDFVEMMKKTDLAKLIETSKMDHLHISENLNVSLLNGRPIESYFVNALSKTKTQTIKGDLFAVNAHINNLRTPMINKKNVSSLLFTNEPCTFEGNVSFSELTVEGNVIARSVNGRSVPELQENLKLINLENLKNLQVFGDVSWKVPSKNENSLSYLLNNAVTKDEDQIITADLTFQNPVIIESLNVEENSPTYRRVKAIISDTVIDDLEADSISVKGTKIFKKGLAVDNLEVTNDLDVDFINGLSVKETASQIYRKYSNDRISSQIMFLQPIEVKKLVTSKKIHGVALEQLARVNERLPEKMHFKNLFVENDVSLYKLDGVIFDEFKRTRVDIREDYDIFGDIEFEESVVVLNGSSVLYINGISPENLVVNGNMNDTTSIYGNKVFLSNVTVQGNIETSTVNELDLKANYNDSVSANQTAEIFGDLTFENSIEHLDSLNVSGSINGLEIQQVVDEHSLQDDNNLTDLIMEKENLIESYISHSMSLSSLSSRGSFNIMYLEEDNSLDLHIPGVQSVRGLTIGSTTRLQLYSAESGDFCGLPVDCPCRRQYTIDFPTEGNQGAVQKNGSGVKFEFYAPNGVDGVRVVHKAVSTGQNCESEEWAWKERSKLYWIGSGNQSHTAEPVVLVDGYIADAQAFLVGDKLYLILAIFYDRVTQSHATDSLVYKFDFHTKEVSLMQSIATDGAKTLHIFHISRKGLHLLIGCVKGRGESLLLRFDHENQMFRSLQGFATGGSRHVASVNSGDDSFVILNNADIDVLQIFAYQTEHDKYHHYQNLPFKSRVTSLNVFYSAIGQSDAFIATTTKDGWFYIHEYMFFGKFQLKISHWVEDIQTLSPFRLKNQNYLFVGLKSNSTIYKLVQQE